MTKALLVAALVLFILATLVALGVALPLSGVYIPAGLACWVGASL